MKRAILATLLVFCPAVPVLAADLEFSAGAEAEYDDNVFRSEDKEDDLLLRLRPGVRIYEDRGDDLNFSAGYEAPIEFSVDNSEELDDVDHIAIGSFEYHVNDRLDFFGREQYGYLRSTLRHGFDTETVDPVTLEINDSRERVTTNDATLGANYHFSPRTTGRLIASSTFFDSTRDDRAQVWSVSGVADAQYKLTLKHQIGAGAGYAYQDFDERDDISGSQTSSYRVFGSWRWLISETLSFDLTAGPAYLETDQEDADRVSVAPEILSLELPNGEVLVSDFANCGTQNGRPVASKCSLDVVLSPAQAAAIPELDETVQITNLDPSGESDEQFTAFADMVLVQRWSPTLSTSLRYTRQQGSASGVGGTSIDDIVALSNTWDFAERWQLAARADYVRRESAFEIAQTYSEVFAGPAVVFPEGIANLASQDAGGGTGNAFNSREDVEIETNTWGVGGRITHHLFKTTSIYAQARYSEQNSRSNSLGSDSDFENFLATFGVRHVFEPIPLW
jgi:hypothetical protein